MKIQKHGSVLLTVADKDKEEALEIAKRFHNIGYQIIATSGTAASIEEAGIPVTSCRKNWCRRHKST